MSAADRRISLEELGPNGSLMVHGEAPAGFVPVVTVDDAGDLLLEVVPEEIARRRGYVMQEIALGPEGVVTDPIGEDGADPVHAPPATLAEPDGAMRQVFESFELPAGPMVWDNSDGTLSYGPAVRLSELRTVTQSTTERPYGEYLAFAPSPDGSVRYHRVINARSGKPR